MLTLFYTLYKRHFMNEILLNNVFKGKFKKSCLKKLNISRWT